MGVESVVTELALLHFSNLKGGNRRNSQVWEKRGDHSGRESGGRFMVHLGGGLPNAKTLAELEAASC